MTKPRDLATLGGGFTQSGTGPVHPNALNKAKASAVLPTIAANNYKVKAPNTV